jgi:hypothetical protein
VLKNEDSIIFTPTRSALFGMAQQGTRTDIHQIESQVHTVVT